ncbi:MAG: TA system VapC family ribonuclease toxin [Terracidiphilus sp.]
MSIWLLDVNVLVARFWEPHVFHRKVRAWMASHENEGWATCPITQAGFVRTLSNPGFSPDGPRPAEAMHWLAQTLKENPSHQFWPDDLELSIACAHSASHISGFKQITDAYLLGLALHRKGKLLTLDRRMLAIAREQSKARTALTILD